MIEAVLFDMDGLMVDTEPIQSRSFEIVLKACGIEPIRNELGVVQTIGITARDNWRILSERHGLELNLDVLVDRKRAVYSQLLTRGVAPMPGLLKLIGELDRRQVKRAIASSSSPQNITRIVNSLGLPAFHAIASGEHVKRGKPFPDIFLHAAELLETAPANCLVLEDAESGVKGADAAGMKVIAVPNHFTQNHDFSDADAVVPSLEKVDWGLISTL